MLPARNAPNLALLDAYLSSLTPPERCLLYTSDAADE